MNKHLFFRYYHTKISNIHTKFRSDNQLQDLINKIVPGFAESERTARTQFYASRGEPEESEFVLTQGQCPPTICEVYHDQFVDLVKFGEKSIDSSPLAQEMWI